MGEPYPVPAEEVRRELVILNSRFIAVLTPAFSVEAARAFLQRMRSEFPDATHHVSAWLIGGGTTVIEHCSDDGEPPGTAGRPALAVLRGSELGDVAVVVIRYFGGTKLGTGGLVRAYTEAVQQVVAAVPRACRLPVYAVMLALPYSLLEQVRRLAGMHQGEILSEDFGADVTMSLHFPVSALAGFQMALKEISAGKLQAEIVETTEKLVRI